MAKEKKPVRTQPAKAQESVKKNTQEEKALQAKKELARQIIERLKAEYPDAGCTLDYN